MKAKALSVAAITGRETRQVLAALACARWKLLDMKRLKSRLATKLSYIVSF